MADDWQPGDLALCVNDTGWCNIESGLDLPGPPPGFVGRVTRVEWCSEAEAEIVGGPCAMLGFADWPDDEYGPADIYFRKINPLTDAERDEELAQLKRDAELSDPAPQIEVYPIDFDTWRRLVRG